jgi:hypothetical protein
VIILTILLKQSQARNETILGTGSSAEDLSFFWGKKIVGPASRRKNYFFANIGLFWCKATSSLQDQHLMLRKEDS